MFCVHLCDLQILSFYSIRGQNKWVNVGYEAIFVPVLFVMAWTALSFIRHQRR